MSAESGTPLGLTMHQQFRELSLGVEGDGEDEDICMGHYVDVGGLDILIPDKFIDGVGHTVKMVPAVLGKVTIDSGAVESVTPSDMLLHVPLVVGPPKTSGVRNLLRLASRWTTTVRIVLRFKKEML